MTFFLDFYFPIFRPEFPSFVDANEKSFVDRLIAFKRCALIALASANNSSGQRRALTAIVVVHHPKRFFRCTEAAGRSIVVIFCRRFQGRFSASRAGAHCSLALNLTWESLGIHRLGKMSVRLAGAGRFRGRGDGT